ncbi:MAG: hypothetical protein IPJ66_20445 [Bacteroidetes bacterium]|nr:hypothetical protein [Bacteroidota bacterium]
MKKATYISLLTILLLQAGGLLLLFQIQQVRIQKSALHQLDSGSGKTEQIVLSEADFNSSKINDHELRMNGKLYDFRYISNSSGQIILNVFHDASEENLIDWIEALATSDGQQQGDLPAHLVKLLTTTYLITDTEPVSFLHTVNEYSFFRFDERAVSFARDQDSPPPKILA